MEKEFVQYEQAIAFKELGFDEPCFSLYLVKDVLGLGVIGDFKLLDYYCQNSKFTVDTLITRPTFSQAFKWFREKHNLYPLFDIIGMGYRTFTIKSMGHKDGNFIHVVYDSITRDELFDDEQKAELECLKKLIKIVKEK